VCDAPPERLLTAPLYSAGKNYFCCGISFLKIDKMVSALLLFFRRATKIQAAP
jgi:hypothetical protein